MSVSIIGIAQSNDSIFVEKYCDLIAVSRGSATKYSYAIDYGNLNYKKNNQIKDSTGNIIEFKSIIDASNWLAKKGWQLHTPFIISIGGLRTYHFIFKRKVKIPVPL